VERSAYPLQGGCAAAYPEEGNFLALTRLQGAITKFVSLQLGPHDCVAGKGLLHRAAAAAAGTSMQTSEGLKLGDDSAVRSSVSKYYGEVRA
jgi:hypothetical protein